MTLTTNRKNTMIVVADPDASDEEKYEIVSIIRDALGDKFPERYFRLFTSEDRDLTLRNMTLY